MAPTGKAAERRPHPRSYGAYPRVLSHYVRERRLFELPVAIRKMTSMPADQVGIRDRGRIARGQKADLVIFDAGGSRTRRPSRTRSATPASRTSSSTATLVVERGEHTGARPGRALRRA